MRKRRVNSNSKLRKILNGLYALTGISTVYRAGIEVQEYKSNKVAKASDNTKENEVGYDNISILNNTSVHNNNFVILHVNKNDNIEILKQKIEFCHKNNISIGLVLDTKALDLATIYSDVDFLQAIVKEYKIDLPVYCNIDLIMQSKELNNAEREEILNAFIDKISRSDMYFGLYGTNTNLIDCNEYITSTKEYDCYVAEDNNEIKYDGTCSIKKDINGNITANQDLSKVIVEKGFNSSHELVFSAKYEVKENDTYHSLSLTYGLSEEDLRTYNNNDQEELKEGQIIAIPNLYKSVNTDTKEVSYNYAIARGIDISNYQSNIDWNRVSQTSEFVIVEVARDGAYSETHNGTYIPECIDQIKNTVENNIELGLYFCISSDMKVSTYEERLESYFNKLNKNLEKNNITLNRENIPVFLDFEIYYEYNDYYKLMTSFEKICNNHGFKKIGIYANRSTLESISTSLNNGSKHIELKDTDWFVWQSGGSQYARYEKNNKGYTLDEIKEPKNETHKQFDIHVKQVTNVCKDTGATNDQGNCDVDFCFSTEVFGNSFDDEIDNTEIECITLDLNNYKGIDAKNIGNSVSSVIMTAGYTILGIELLSRYLIIKCKKIKQKIKTK